jgi:hypothetical protein
MPKIKSSYQTLNEVPENAREFYTEKDGKYVIDAEGVLAEEEVTNLKKALDSQRNIANDLNRKVKPWEILAAELNEDITPERVREIREKYQKLQEDLEAITKDDSKKIDIAVAERVKALEDRSTQDRIRYESLTKEEKARADKFESIYRDGLFHSAISTALGELVHPTAIEDLVYRARKFGWKLDDDGQMVALNFKGDPIYSASDPRQTITLNEWVNDIAYKEAPHAFKQSSGTGDRMKAGNGGMPRRMRTQMSNADKSDFIEKYGLAAYQSLPEK